MDKAIVEWYGIHAHGYTLGAPKALVTVPCNCMVIAYCELGTLYVSDEMNTRMMNAYSNMKDKKITIEILQQISEATNIENDTKFCIYGPGSMIANIHMHLENSGTETIACNMGVHAGCDDVIKSLPHPAFDLNDIFSKLSTWTNKFYVLVIFACRSCKGLDNTTKIDLFDSEYKFPLNDNIDILAEFIDSYSQEKYNQCEEECHIHIDNKGIHTYNNEVASPECKKQRTSGGSRERYYYPIKYDKKQDNEKYIIYRKKKWYLRDHRGQYRYSADKSAVRLASTC